jgi:hypothetical protein
MRGDARGVDEGAGSQRPALQLARLIPAQ